MTACKRSNHSDRASGDVELIHKQSYEADTEMVHLDYYTEAIHGKHEYLDLGHFEFEMGASLPNANSPTGHTEN